MARRRKKKADPSVEETSPLVDGRKARAVTSLSGLIKDALQQRKTPVSAALPPAQEAPPEPAAPPVSAPPPPILEPEEPAPLTDARSLRLLNDAYQGATPLSQSGRRTFARAARAARAARRAGVVPSARPMPSESTDDLVRRRLGALVGEGVRFRALGDAMPGSALREGVARKELRRLRSPQFHPEASLDLHGEQVAAVDLAVSRFIREHQRRGCRFLLIVHGKGLHSESGEGVLGPAVFAALTRGGAAPLVRALCHPHERLGGRGATAVALM